MTTPENAAEMTVDNCPKVSVLLPVRDGEEFIAGAVASLLDQSFADFELLVMDDGSRDRTTDIVSKMADDRVCIVSDGKGRGLAARLNQGIDLARGHYLARMDADDLCFPSRLEQQVRFLDAHSDIDLVSGRAMVFQDKTFKPIGMLPYRQSHEAIAAYPWRGFYMPHPTWMGRTEWFRRFRYRFPEVLRAEDQELLLRALPESRYHSLSEILLAYRQGPFDYRKTLRARRSLLAAQVELFGKRGELANALKAILITATKMLVDTIAIVPGCERAFFARMAQPLPDNLESEFHSLVRRCHSGERIRPESAEVCSR